MRLFVHFYGIIIGTYQATYLKIRIYEVSEFLKMQTKQSRVVVLRNS